jgi:hypothetical protein
VVAHGPIKKREKEAKQGLKRHFLGEKMGKIRGSQLLIRQQGKNASY